MVNNCRSLSTVKGLRVHDVLELIHSLCGVFHVSSQVAVEETEHVAIERQTDRHATFVALRDKQEEIRTRGNTCSVTRAKRTHELFLTFWKNKTKWQVTQSGMCVFLTHFKHILFHPGDFTHLSLFLSVAGGFYCICEKVV